MITALGLLLLVTDGYGQSFPVMAKYSVTDGLPGRFIPHLMKDSRGLLWISTTQGLCRFDGQHLKSYELIVDGKPAETQVVYAAEDANGHIIFATNEYGIRRILYRKPNGFSFDTTFALPEYHVTRSITPTPKGYWLCGNYGLAFHNNEGKKELLINNRNSNLPNKIINFAEPDGSGNLWVGCDTGGLFRIAIAELAPEKHRYHFTRVSQLPIESFTCVQHNKNKKIMWFFSDRNRMYYALTGSTELARVMMPDTGWSEQVTPAVTSLNQHNDHSFFININGRGLCLADTLTKTITSVSYTYHENWDETPIAVSHFYDSTERICWLGTETGLLKINMMPPYIRKYSLDFGNIPIFRTRCILEVGKDTFWIGTRGSGIYEITLKNEEMKVLNHYKYDPSSAKNPIGYNVINRLYKDRKGNIWVSSNVPLYRFDRRTRIFKRYLNESTWSAYEARDGTMWFGTYESGIKKLDPVTGKHQNFLTDTNLTGYQFVRSNTIWYILPYNDTLLWLATNMGMIGFDIKNEKYVEHLGKGAWNNLPIWFMKKQPDGSLLISSHGSGLWSFHPFTGKETQLFKSPRHLFGFEEDPTHHKLVIAETGVLLIDPSYRLLKWHTRSDNINAEHYSYLGHLTASNGNVIFVGNTGLTVFSKEGYKQEYQPAPVSFTSLYVRNKDFSDYLENGTIIELPYDDNSISVGFSTGLRKDTRTDKLLYMLVDVDESWNPTNEFNRISYSGLAPGTYTLMIKQSLPEGMPHKSLTFVINPAFWQTWWFKTLYISLAAAVLALIIYMQINRQKLKQKITMSEIDSLRLQMNPHFIFNSLNSIQDFIFSSNKKDATNYLSKFAKLMRQILENSKQSMVTVEEEIAFLKLYLELELLRMNNRFSYSISVDDEVHGLGIKVPPMIIQPIIENALKHGFADHQSTLSLHLGISNTKHYLVWSITDNGIGRTAALQKQKNYSLHRSFGTNIVENRLKMLGESFGKNYYISYTDLFHQEGGAAGTKVEIFFEY